MGARAVESASGGVGFPRRVAGGSGQWLSGLADHAHHVDGDFLRLRLLPQLSARAVGRHDHRRHLSHDELHRHPVLSRHREK